MRIFALVTEAFGGRGGIAHYNRDLLTALCAHPKSTQVVAIPRLAMDPLGPLPTALQWESGATNSRFRFCLKFVKLLLRGPRPDLVVCGHINLLPLGWIARTLTRAPLILIIHGIDAWCPTGRWPADLLAKQVDAVIAVSVFTMERFASWSGVRNERAFLVPNAVSMKRYGLGKPNLELQKRYGLSNCYVMVTVARLSGVERYKGIDEILEVFPELIDEISNLRYLVVGDGDDAPRLQDKALRLGIADKVTFAGYIAENELADHYRLADAFVMPGRGEGFGRVFLEAMACGIPVVASKLDGSREAVKDGELGILVDPDDREELKAGILQALKRPRAIPDGLAYFSFENFARRVEAVVDSTLDLRSD